MLGINIGAEGDGGPVEGVEIQGITPGGAADDAGLRSGDMLTAVNGEILSSDSSFAASRKLLDFMSGVKEGDVLDFDYLRDGSTGRVSVEPRSGGPMPFTFAFRGPNFSPPGAPNAPDAPQVYAYRWMQQGGHGFGDMEMVELNENLGRYFGTDSGLLIVRAPSDNAFGLQDGDVIKRIDGREPKDLYHAVRILSSYENGETVNFEIMRDKRKETLTVAVPDDRTSMVTPVVPVAPSAAVAAPHPKAPHPRAPRPVKESTVGARNTGDLHTAR